MAAPGDSFALRFAHSVSRHFAGHEMVGKMTRTFLVPAIPSLKVHVHNVDLSVRCPKFHESEMKAKPFKLAGTSTNLSAKAGVKREFAGTESWFPS